MVNKELVAASSKPLVLSILAGGEDYGYQIIKRVRELSGGALEWTDGMLYPVLHRLERDGLVESTWRKGLAGAGRKRKYYRLSVKGRRALEGEREQWRMVNETLDKVWAAGCASHLIAT